MNEREWHLAQVNIGRIRAPMNDPVMSEFAAALDEINALAEAAPGYVWRLKDTSGNATAIAAFPDPLILVNMSVWKSIEDLKAYAYRSAHGKIFARRHAWFEKRDGASLALWWIPAGQIPTLEDARHRLALLDSSGPTANAFHFQTSFPPQAATAEAL